MLELFVLVFSSLQIFNIFLDFRTIFVFDSEIFSFNFHFSDLCLHFILFLDISDQHIEVFFETVDLFVDVFCNFVFFGLVEDEVFHLSIQLLYQSHKLFRCTLDVLDFAQNVFDFIFLHFQVLDNLHNSLQILVSLDIFGHFLPLSIVINEHFFFVLKFRNGIFNLFFDVFDFVNLVLVFNFLV